MVPNRDGAEGRQEVNSRRSFFRSIIALGLAPLALPLVAAAFEPKQADLFRKSVTQLNSEQHLALQFGGFMSDGGEISGDKAYLVGEGKPELCVPCGPGKIIKLRQGREN